MMLRFISTVCVFFLSLSTLASVPPTSTFIQLESFKQLKVGDSIGNLSHLTSERTRWGKPRHVAQSYFYLLRSDLPSRCLNMQCGRFARKILARNGFLVGGADPELARDVGLDYISQNTDHDQSLLIVTNPAGKITGIFKNVSPENLDDVLGRLNAAN